MASLNSYKLVDINALNTNFLISDNVSSEIKRIGYLPRKRIKLDDINTPIIYKSKYKKVNRYPIFWAPNMNRLWSPEIINLISDNFENIGDIQFLPVEIRSSEGNIVYTDYKIINNLNTRDIINFKKSKIKWDKNRELNIKYISQILKFIPNYEAGDNLPILEIELWPRRLFFHEKLVQAITEKKLKNIRFFDPEKDAEEIKYL